MAGHTGARRGLTGGEVAVILLTIVLVGVFLAMLAARMAPDGDAGATPTAAGDATASTDGGTDDDAAPVTFALPSGNIACRIAADSADCVITDFAYDAVDAAGCEGEAGGHLRVDADGASMPCEPLVVAGDVEVLGYGRSHTAYGFTCTSAESGVTCQHDESGHGFTVARAAYELF